MKKVLILLTLILSQSLIFASFIDTEEVSVQSAAVVANLSNVTNLDYDSDVMKGRKMRSESIYYYQYDQINKVWNTVVNMEDPDGPPLTKQQYQEQLASGNAPDYGNNESRYTCSGSC